MVPMHAQTRKGALHEPAVWSSGFSRPVVAKGSGQAHSDFSAGPPKGGTPYQWHAQFRFMVPKRGCKAVEALHEPPVWSSGFSRPGPPEGGTPYRGRAHGKFMGPMRAKNRVEALHEPAGWGCAGERSADFSPQEGWLARGLDCFPLRICPSSVAVAAPLPLRRVDSAGVPSGINPAPLANAGWRAKQVPATHRHIRNPWPRVETG